MPCLQCVIAFRPVFDPVRFTQGAYLELSQRRFSKQSIAKVILLKQLCPWASTLEYICLKVRLLSTFQVLATISYLQGGSICLISRKILHCFFIFFSPEHKNNWHNHLWLTMLYLPVNVPNYSVKHRQCFCSVPRLLKWKCNHLKVKVFHSLASKWIYSWQFTLLMQDYTNERVKRWCVYVCVCVAFLCF